MKIIALIPVWHRFELLKMAVESLLQVKEIEPILIISPGEFPEIISYAYQFRHVWAINKPIGAKLNTGIIAIRNLEYDYLMNWGSDDILNKELFDLYTASYFNKFPFFGLSGCHIYNSLDNSVYYWDIKGVGYSIGAGRMIHKEIFRRLGSPIYQPSFNSGLDSCSSDLIQHVLGIKQVIIKSEYPYILDIKTDENISKFNDLIINNKLKQVDYEKIICKFGKIGRKATRLFQT